MIKSKVSNLENDFIASHLRADIALLDKLLKDFEFSGSVEHEYAVESLKKVEGNLKRLRGFLK